MGNSMGIIRIRSFRIVRDEHGPPLTPPLATLIMTGSLRSFGPPVEECVPSPRMPREACGSLTRSLDCFICGMGMSFNGSLPQRLDVKVGTLSTLSCPIVYTVDYGWDFSKVALPTSLTAASARHIQPPTDWERGAFPIFGSIRTVRSGRPRRAG